ncbi:M16 family metallopeptidase [Roseomonas marmotae]|uniref:Insulinase family protein n=1 Tax=Roseomonas marmotae TaxID=2768161 RepID=A0ABS3K7M0_9PROT|nr:pitrilysin family protein [Roseomonas marmotae]MBO1073448.1 insulinase family protein [Roseomonas marmotae]QTI80356.1 insulinase family protein [Roseomonas marmotae]
MSGSNSVATGFSMPIQVVEAAGCTAWLAEDHSVPVVSLSWGWDGGAALDPAGQEGAASLASSLLTEGAGDLDALAFADAARDEAIGLGFDGDRDSFDGSLRALLPALPRAVELARLAMTAPRFDEEAVNRIRARAIASARRALEGPRGRASRAFWAAAFPGHPAGRPASGTAESIAAITVGTMRDLLGRQLRREGLLVAASGAITAPQLAALLPELFGSLPAGTPPSVPPLPAFTAFGTQVVPVPAPQSTLIFGQQGIPVQDPDWEVAQVVLRVFSGGGFSSRLMKSLREERGLTYGIYAGLDSLFGGSALVGSGATANARVGEALKVLRDEWARMAETGPTAQEMEDAVSFLTGSQPLQFTDSRGIAGTLLAMRRNKRPLDWLERRPERLRAITRDQAARVAARLLVPGSLSITIAGQPEGV